MSVATSDSGGNRGVEDCRWAFVRADTKPWQFQVFSRLFVIIYQSSLLARAELGALW